jgi:hypothetical protein
MKFNLGLSKKFGLHKPMATLGILVPALFSCGRQATNDDNGLPPPKPETIRWRGQETGYQAGSSDDEDVEAEQPQR